jgi:hypothetical protein
MNLQALELQKALAQAVANGVREKWERIVVNYEMQTTDEGREVDYCAFYISTADGDFRETSIRELASAVDDLFIQLNDTMAQNDKSRWTIADLVIDRSGKYDFKFDYGPAKRLNGVFDETSQGRFDKYLDTYRAERAAG